MSTRRRILKRRRIGDRVTDPAHAPGKRRKAPPPDADLPNRGQSAQSRRDQPWVPTSGLIGRKRRSARRS